MSLDSEEAGFPKSLLRILGSILSYGGIWAVFVSTELAAWLVRGHCHIVHFNDGSYFIDCVCYQPGYQGKC